MSRFTSDSFFKISQPLSYYIRVAFRLPTSMYGKENPKNWKMIYDDFYGHNGWNYFIHKDNDGTPWLEITKDIDGRYNNNFIVSGKITDNMGFKEFEVNLVDRNFSVIEDILFLTQLSQYVSQTNGAEERVSNYTLNTKSTKNEENEESTENKESAEDKENEENKVKAINEVFINDSNINNIKIKIGYFNSRENRFKLETKTETSKEQFSKRKAWQTTIESPWFDGVITSINRSIEEVEVYYSIMAKSSVTSFFDSLSIEREYAIIKASPYNMLNIINDVVDVYCGIPGHKRNVFKEKEITKQNAFGDYDVKNKEQALSKLYYFFKHYYNPAYAVPPVEKGKYDSNTPFEEQEKSSPYGDFPRNKWIKFQGEKEASAVRINYQLLDKPSPTFSFAPRATLGTILNEILRQIPPKRYLVSDKGKVEEMTDEDEKTLASYNNDLSYVLVNKRFIDADDSWRIDETLNSIYSYKIETTGTERKINGKKLGYEKRLIFYYPDKKNILDNIKSEKHDIRVYRVRHPKSVVEKFNFRESGNMYVVFNLAASGVVNEPNKNYNRKSNLYKALVKTIKDLKSKVNSEEDLSEEDKSKIKEKIKSLQKKIKSVKQSGITTNNRNKGGSYTIKNTANINKKKASNVSLGDLKTTSNPHLYNTLSMALASKATLTVIGDPYWFFGDKAVKPGETLIKIEVYRPNFKHALKGEKDIILSGYYTVLKLIHNISLSGWTTQIQCQKVVDQTKYS